jgi:hypothetical protein
VDVEKEWSSDLWFGRGAKITIKTGFVWGPNELIQGKVKWWEIGKLGFHKRR